MGSANVSLIQTLYAAFGRGDIATIIAAVTPDLKWSVNGRREDYPLFGTWTGPGGAQEFFRLVAEYQEFSEFSPRDFFGTDDRVFVLGHYKATIHKTGRKFDCDWIHVFTVKGGKVAAFREFTDTAQIAQAWR